METQETWYCRLSFSCIKIVGLNQSRLKESIKGYDGCKIVRKSAKRMVLWPLIRIAGNSGDMSPEFLENQFRRVWRLAWGSGCIYCRNTFDPWSFYKLRTRFWFLFVRFKKLQRHCLLSFELVDRPESSFVQNPFTIVESDSIPCKKYGNGSKERGCACSTGSMETSETCLLSFCKKLGYRVSCGPPAARRSKFH